MMHAMRLRDQRWPSVAETGLRSSRMPIPRTTSSAISARRVASRYAAAEHGGAHAPCDGRARDRVGGRARLARVAPLVASRERELRQLVVDHDAPHRPAEPNADPREQDDGDG